MNEYSDKALEKQWRDVLYEVIFKSDTPAGKTFDVALIICIVFSVLAVMLDSVSAISVKYGRLLRFAEWFFTILFTIEYVLRLICVRRAMRYATSFFGVVDLLAILPTYLSLFIFGSRYLGVIRILRVLRIFRVLKLGHHMKEAKILREALYASRHKIIVFLFAVLTLVVIIGSLMYVIEGEEHGFTSIPQSAYWAIVTLTTVGYGDMSPGTGLGQFLASIVMILGYSIIAVPTGIMTVEISHAYKAKRVGRVCTDCGKEGHDTDAQHCKFCGSKL